MNASKVLKYPGLYFKRAGQGVSYLKNLIKPSDVDIDPTKLYGEDLKQELEKVKAQSSEFKNEKEVKEDYDPKQKLKSYRYVCKNNAGQIVKGIFDGRDEQDCRVFLSNEGYEILEITERGKGDIDISFGSGKISTGDLSFALIQLSTYIKAGIPLIDSMRILSKQTSKEHLKRTYDKVIYQLVLGEPFSVALERQGEAFPSILINMVKTSEMTGDLAGTLDEMADYFTKTETTKKEMISALIYPVVILIVVIAVLIFMVVKIVPQFVGMFEQNGAELPAITQFVLDTSHFFTSYWWALIIGVFTIVFTFRWSYKNIREFRRSMQVLLMKSPVFGKVVINGEVATITRTFSSLLNHGVFITDSMEILMNLTNNEIYKEILSRTLIGLSKGSKLSETFKGEWAFPVVAYEMIVTGESTGQLALMMEKVAEHYDMLHHNAVSALKSLLEPMVILLLAVSVGFILISIMTPMFDMYGQI